MNCRKWKVGIAYIYMLIIICENFHSKMLNCNCKIVHNSWTIVKNCDNEKIVKLIRRV